MNGLLTEHDRPDRQNMGGKGFALAELRQAGFVVPSFFVVSPEFANIDSPTPESVDDFDFSKEQREALTKAIQSIGGSSYAVRSSALDEDGAEASFAGQMDSFLEVRSEDIPERIKDVWRSAFSEHILSYRKEKGIEGALKLPAVVVQCMVDADCAGVAFSADVVTGRWSTTVVSAVEGLGEKLVSGEADAENWKIDQDGNVIEKEPASGRRFVLSEAQAKEVTQLARKSERYFGRPQDIEWAYSKGKLYLLQSRPITTLHRISDPDGALNIWDNSNIAESYGGVTTPLTFSFAHYIYKEVYQQFCAVLHVPAQVIEDNRSVFNGMLGLIRGRVYYNLMSWYRVLALLPGFRFNRKFMEQMMGVKEGLPESVLKEFEDERLGARMKDGARLAWCVLGLMKAQIQLPKMIERFYAHFDATLADIESPIEDMRADQLAAHFHQLEQQLLSRWNAPLVNDFFAMIYFGVLRALTQKWCEDSDGTLQNGLLCGTGNIVSAEPAKRIRQMAKVASKDRTLVDTLCEGSLKEIQNGLNLNKELNTQYSDYLDRFADRCLNELKLESPTLRDDPLPLLRSVGTLAKRMIEGLKESDSPETSIQSEAEGRVAQALSGKAIKRGVFNYVLKQARRRVRDRENLRFERTRLFGRIRTIFVELGKRLNAVNILEEARDVFYLEIDEVLGFVEGTSTTTDLKSLVSLRKKEFAAFAEEKAPADRFETTGIVNVANTFESKNVDVSGDETSDLKGIGCCPGVVKGNARVITDPRGVQMKPGEILVAEQTDPGWITLFPASVGVLVQRGSLLSHTAIVSREMGIPAVVSITGLLDKVKTGDLIEFDGKTGRITLLENE